MKIKVYVIDFETPRWLLKGLAYGMPAMIVLGVAAVVIAAPVQWGASESYPGITGCNASMAVLCCD